MKQLKDYTLEEVKKECMRHTACDGVSCKFFALCFPYNDKTDEMPFPSNWNLEVNWSDAE